MLGLKVNIGLKAKIGLEAQVVGLGLGLATQGLGLALPGLALPGLGLLPCGFVDIAACQTHTIAAVIVQGY